MRRFVVLEKEMGETPLQAIRHFQESDPELLRLPMTYAGRLDPMAQGKLLVLIGDECKRRAKYDGLDKEYLFEVLLGFKSDTGDVLGLPTAELPKNLSIPDPNAIARSMIGTYELPYPAFSSKPVAGKPLFQYALEGTLDTIQIPTTTMRVYSMQYVDRLSLPRASIIERILDRIQLLKIDREKTNIKPDIKIDVKIDLSDALGADFRKDQISKEWWNLQNRTISNCVVLRFRATVSSGTYIRSLAPLIARECGTVGLAYSINRTKIGKYQPLGKGVGFWTRTY